MKVLIIEDEPASANRLVKLLGEVSQELNVLDVIDTVEDSITFLETHTCPDLLFMDIHLADGNSFEIFEKLDVRCPIIFITAYDQYAIKAFKVNSLDYLLKPVKREELAAALNKFHQTVLKNKRVIPDYTELANILQQPKKEYLKRFMVKTGQNIKSVEISDVAYFVVENKIVSAIIKSGQRFILDFTMDYLEKSLNPERFFRINRSFILGFDSIDTMVAYSRSRIKINLNPASEHEAITSTERSAAFKDWLGGH